MQGIRMLLWCIYIDSVFHALPQITVSVMSLEKHYKREATRFPHHLDHSQTFQTECILAILRMSVCCTLRTVGKPLCTFLSRVLETVIKFNLCRTWKTTYLPTALYNIYPTISHWTCVIILLVLQLSESQNRIEEGLIYIQFDIQMLFCFQNSRCCLVISLCMFNSFSAIFMAHTAYEEVRLQPHEAQSQ